MASKRNYFFQLAKIAEEVERYQDVVQAIKSAIIINPILTIEERNIFASAYQAVVNQRKISWKTIKAFQRKEELKQSKNIMIAKNYKNRIEGEIFKYCIQIIDLIDKLLPSCTQELESQKFYLKMKADYYRCIHSFTDMDENKEFLHRARQAYQQAMRLANNLNKSKSLRYLVALYYSQFCGEVINNLQLACQISKEALSCNISEFCHMPIDEENYKEATFLMQMIRDNLTLWSSQLQDSYQ